MPNEVKTLTICSLGTFTSGEHSVTVDIDSAYQIDMHEDKRLSTSIFEVVEAFDVDNDGDGFTENEGDCNDADASVYPGAVEIAYDGVDQDCSGGDLVDVDGDGHNAIIAGGDDCDDNNASIHPGAVDICGNAIDEDCSGSGLSCSDVDNDDDGFTENEGDCNDADASVYPGAVEICGNGVDEDCDGSDLSCSTVTIKVTKAVYLARKNTLTVEATSDLGEAANLELVGYGPMEWNRKKSIWKIAVSGIGQDPGSVTVAGAEGTVTEQTTAKGGKSKGGKPNK